MFGVPSKNRNWSRFVPSRGGVVPVAAADLTAASDQTLTVAQLEAGVLTRDPNGAARTDTTPTAALIEARFPRLQVNDYFCVFLINTADAAEAITLAGGTGVTLSNVGQTIGQNEAALLLFRKTATDAFTVYIIGA